MYLIILQYCKFWSTVCCTILSQEDTWNNKVKKSQQWKEPDFTANKHIFIMPLRPSSSGIEVGLCGGRFQIQILLVR